MAQSKKRPTTQEIQDTLITIEQYKKREQFLYETVLKFHREIEQLGGAENSKAYSDSLCLYASDWQASIDLHIQSKQ
jgi:hypothetical protein